jgi:hypothetical protein
MTNLGVEFKPDLEIGTTRSPQHPYNEPIPAGLNFDGAEPVLTPMDPNATLSNRVSPRSSELRIETASPPLRRETIIASEVDAVLDQTIVCD